LVVLREWRDTVSQRIEFTHVRVHRTRDAREVLVDKIFAGTGVDTQPLIVELLRAFCAISRSQTALRTISRTGITMHQILCQKTAIRTRVIALVLKEVNMR